MLIIIKVHPPWFTAPARQSSNLLLLARLGRKAHINMDYFAERGIPLNALFTHFITCISTCIVPLQTRHQELFAECAQLTQRAEGLRSESTAGSPSVAAPEEVAAAACLEQVGSAYFRTCIPCSVELT